MLCKHLLCNIQCSSRVGKIRSHSHRLQCPPWPCCWLIVEADSSICTFLCQSEAAVLVYKRSSAAMWPVWHGVGVWHVCNFPWSSQFCPLSIFRPAPPGCPFCSLELSQLTWLAYSAFLHHSHQSFSPRWLQQRILCCIVIWHFLWYWLRFFVLFCISGCWICSNLPCSFGEAWIKKLYSLLRLLRTPVTLSDSLHF